MAEPSEKLFAKLSVLNDSLDDLEDKLDSLLAQTLPESLLPLETIQQVKLNVALPYLVYDLIFIYLKTRGIDPKTHPVVAELDRVRKYFDKIKNAEDPEKRKAVVDKAAANRFIKHAIAQAKQQRPPGEHPSGSGPSHIRFDADGNAPAPHAQSSAAAASVPAKVTSKMLAREEYQKQLAAERVESDVDGDDDDNDGLQVYDDARPEGEDGSEDSEQSPKAKGKGKAVTQENSVVNSEGKKRRRPAMDPFAGYGEGKSTKTDKPPKRKKAKSLTSDSFNAADSSSSNTQIKSGKKKETGTSRKTKR